MSGDGGRRGGPAGAEVTSFEDTRRVISLMRRDPLFRWCSERSLRPLASSVRRRRYRKGEYLIREGRPQTRVFFVQSGVIARDVVRPDGREAQLTDVDSLVFGTTACLRSEPARASLRCEGDVEVYELESLRLGRQIRADPDLAEEIIYGLTRQRFASDSVLRTPVFQQDSRRPKVLATTVAATAEAFYRSMMNELLNRKLLAGSGSAKGSLFPRMHQQIPARILYINGFKTVRHYLDSHMSVRPSEGGAGVALRVGMACVPGAVMTPLASYLEACNAHTNPIPISRRWLCGIAPRCSREVIFGIGLNQMTDYFEERCPREVSNPAIRTSLGSVAAGVVSGYLSHVPHNLATLKLLDPSQSYRQHYHNLSQAWDRRLPARLPFKPAAARLLTLLAPKGVHIRTAQVVGTFCILNGIIGNFPEERAYAALRGGDGDGGLVE